MPWTVRALDDEQVIGATNRKLRLNDLTTLCGDHEWMTDALIDYGVTVCPTAVGGARYGHLHDGVFWIEPTVVASATAADFRREIFNNTLGGALAMGGILDTGGGRPVRLLGVIHLDDVAQRVLPQDAKVLLFPINTENRHWSLLAFYKEGRNFVHYDSLPGAGNTAVATALVKKLHETGFLSRELPITRSADLPAQDDGYNCGVFVIQVARLHMATGGKPAGPAIALIDSPSCEAFRLTMLRSLGLLVADGQAQAMYGPDGGAPPKSEAVRSEEKAKLTEQIKKVEAQLVKEEEGPIELSGMKPCPLSEAASVVVTIESGDKVAHNFDSAKVIFTVGKEKFARKAVKDGLAWKVEAQFKATEAFDVEIEAQVSPGPGFEKEGVDSSTERTLRAHEKRQVKFSFKPKPDRKLFAKFLVEDPKGDPRPLPAGFVVDFKLDLGNQKVTAQLDAHGCCSPVIPWTAATVGLAFPGKDWRKISWPESAPKGAAVTIDVVAAPGPDTKTELLLPNYTWELQRDEWHIPDVQFTGEVFDRQLDLSKPGTLGTEAEPLIYILNAGAIPSKSFRMNGRPVDHVVVLMLENRGFDHFMGYLYEGADKPKNNYPKKPLGDHAALRPFEGLDGIKLDNPYDYSYQLDRTLRTKVPRRINGVVPLKKGARAANTPKINPHEDFIHVMQDMYGKDIVKDPHDMEDPAKRKGTVQNADGTWKKAPMNGWAQNYCDGIRHHAGEKTELTHEMVSEIMDMFLPDQLPVLSGLAKHYAVSDLWFCSVPSQTNTNRSFWITGSAAGMVKNDFYPAHPTKAAVLAGAEGLASDKLPKGDSSKGEMFHRRSLFDVLDESGVSWKYYYTLYWPPKIGDIWPIDLCPQFEPKRNTHFPLIAQFYKDAEAGSLPAVTYLEPLWGGGKVWDTSDPRKRFVGNEFHPVQDITNGEFFVKEVYDALFGDKEEGGKLVPRNPKRDTTVLCITFDENGGTFDHMSPWKAKPTGREPAVTQYDFKFDCYGVRVPTLLIGKHIPPGTIFRSPTETPFDHASVLSTILKWRGIPAPLWKLGKRVEDAPTFDGVLEHDGSAEEERHKVATGMAAFDKERAKIAVKGQEIKYGDVFSLRYVGDRWAFDANAAAPKNQDVVSPIPAPDWLGGPESAKNWLYPIGTRDPGKSLKLKFTGGTDGTPVKAGMPCIIKVHEGKAAGYSLAVPEVMGADCAFLYQQTVGPGGSRDSKWLPWVWNDRNKGEPLYWGDEILLMAERYEPERLTLYYDPYQRLSFDKYDPKTPGLKRWARFRAGEWDIWKIEKPVALSLKVSPSLTSERTRPVFDGGPEKTALPIKCALKLVFETAPAPKDVDLWIRRSASSGPKPRVELFLDAECKKPIAFAATNVATLDDKTKASLCKGEAVPVWARTDGQYCTLNFQVSKLNPKATAVPGTPSMLQICRAYGFLEGTSKWLQLIDSFESVEEIKASITRLRSLSALADMGTDELANFAIKRLFIQRGVLQQPVVIKIDGRQVTLKHPLTEGQLPLRYSDFVVDRSGPKFLGALDADVAVEALMYKDACISTTLAELKKKKNEKGKPLAPSFDSDLVQSVRDLAERRWRALKAELPANYPDLAELEIEAATSLFEQKHMAQRKLSDFDLTARETETLSRAIGAALVESCGQLPDALVLKIGSIAWSRGGPINTTKVKAANATVGNDVAKAAAYEASVAAVPENDPLWPDRAPYTPLKKYKHGAYKGTGYYHILIDEVGALACRLLDDSFPDVDAGYGLGIPYMGPEVMQKDGGFARQPNPIAEEHDRFEIGDIITDETSHYGTVFSHNLNIQDALGKLTGAGVRWSYAAFDKNKNLRDNARELIRGSGKADIAKAYFDREALIDTVLMFEQVAKKEAQSQLFKAQKNLGKLIGNISDVSQFLYGAEIAAMVAETSGDKAKQQRMLALKEVTMLSCIIAFPRWSVFAKNVDQAKDTAALVEPKELAKSINERSYAHKKLAPGDLDPDAPRLHVEWAGIDEAIAKQRLDDFSAGMKPIWDFVAAQKAHFQAMDTLLKAVKTGADRTAALKAVHDGLAAILPKLANLAAQVKGQEEALVNALTLQAEESAVFQGKRAPKDEP